MRRSDHPNRPSAITCCFLSSLKTLLTRTQGNSRVRINVLDQTFVGRFSSDNHWPHLSDYRGTRFAFDCRHTLSRSRRERLSTIESYDFRPTAVQKVGDSVFFLISQANPNAIGTPVNGPLRSETSKSCTCSMQSTVNIPATQSRPACRVRSSSN